MASILKQPSTKTKSKSSDNMTKSKNEITSFIIQRDKGALVSTATNNASASALGKRSPIPEKDKPSSKYKLVHNNRYESLSDDNQTTLHSPDDKTNSPRPKEPKKTSKKPSSLKEAVRQVQQDHSNLHINVAPISPKNDLNKNKEDTQLARSSPKKISHLKKGHHQKIKKK